jgi:hypothetical protein
MTPDAAKEAAVTRARLRKATALAEVLLAHGATGATVAALPEASRRTVEILAGVPVSSDATWQMTADLVGARRALAGRVGPGPGRRSAADVAEGDALLASFADWTED